MTRKRRIPKYQSQPEWPPGAIAADLSQQALNNSCGPAVIYYVDRPFECVDCGALQIWTAKQQKWYYEFAKGPLSAIAVRCRACRRKRRETLGKTGDPNPIKHLRSILKRVEKAIAAAAETAGFGRPSRLRMGGPCAQAIEYSKSDSILACAVDHRRMTLTAEMIQGDQVITITRVPLSSYDGQLELLAKIQEFSAAIIGFLTDDTK